MSAPFFLDAASFGFAALLVLTLRGSFRAPREPTNTATVRADIVEGLRWLFRHRLLRSLAIALGVMNLVGMAAMTILVLYAKEVLHLSNTQFGLLLTTEAAGAVLGSMMAARLARRFGNGITLTVAIAVSAASFLVPAFWAQPVAVAASLAVGGFGGLVWNVLTVSLRQSLVPDELLGRVNSAYRLFGWGTMPLGAISGGLIATAFGLRAPFLVAGVTALLLAVWISTRATNRSIERARRRAAAEAGAASKAGRVPPLGSRRRLRRHQVAGDASEAAEVGDLVGKRRHVHHHVGSVQEFLAQLGFSARHHREVLERFADGGQHARRAVDVGNAIQGCRDRSALAAQLPGRSRTGDEKRSCGSVLFSTNAPRWYFRRTSSSQNRSPSRRGASSSVVTTANVVRLSWRSCSTARDRATNPSYIDWKFRKNSAMSWRN